MAPLVVLAHTMQRSPPLSSGVPENVGAREVDHPCVDAHEQGGALAVVGAASALAKGTAGVEPAGKAEIATAAKLEALVPWAQGEPGREVDSLPQGDKVMYKPPPEALPPEGWRNHEPSPQKGERKQEALPQSRNARVPERGPDVNPKSRRCCRMAAWSTYRHKRMETNSLKRRRRESTRSTHHHKRASTNAARRHKAAQTRANSCPTWPRESHRAKTTYIIMKNRNKTTEFPSCHWKREPGEREHVHLARTKPLGSRREAAEGVTLQVEKAC